MINGEAGNDPGLGDSLWIGSKITYFDGTFVSTPSPK